MFNVVTGQGETAGDALVTHPDVAMVSLTGDVATGKLIARNAADSLKRVHLELGGKAPVVVFDDADLEPLVATLAEAGYYNSGQDCTAPCRVIAGPGVYDDAGGRPAERRGRHRDRRPRSTRPPRSVRSCPRAQQERVAGMVDRARRGGAEVIVGGSVLDRPGFFYAPTVVANPAQDAEIVQREVFGPVVIGAALHRRGPGPRVGQRRRLRPGRRVWTTRRRPGHAHEPAAQFGTVWVNDHIPIVSELPHGGFKQSGYGKDMSIYAIEHYTELKHVMVKF